MKYTKTKTEIENSIGVLKVLKPGTVIYTRLHHVSKSGMQRRISLYTVRDDDIWDITYHTAVLLGDRISKDGGIVTGGCGMDVGFQLVYNLGCAVFPGGFRLAKNQLGRNGNTSCKDSNGGYAFTHRWL
jgi:hypothetical protein